MVEYHCERMKPFTFLFILSSLISFQASSQECHVEGLDQSPQSLECEYRDGWYIKMFYKINCDKGHYVFTLSTRHDPSLDGGVIHSAFSRINSDGKTELHFINKYNQELQITRLIGQHYRGKMIENSLHHFDFKTHCRVP